ncbi:hypothetical protein KHM83_12930 [Fusibacter paucivorans]|uniref:Uncharacterized protein n=1 Tax=Fusibacter paucivorans TaxID=76009 RepID=A0ABS5PU78_9FIRM|nr:hypothetical protein [Fusibacter paucivorans]MBS7527582.1 hypothetical protein [Fusibacter paucivorans]
MYDIRDVVQKAIGLSVRKKEIYEQQCQRVEDPGLQLVIRIIVKQIDKDIEHYQAIIANITNEMAGAIDFGTYDKISSLVNQFSNVMIAPDIQTRHDFMTFVIALEESLYALLIDIQGRMVVNEVVAASVSYYVLSELIEEKGDFVKKLKSL